MNADGLVSGERCNCEGQLKAEAELGRVKSEQKFQIYPDGCMCDGNGECFRLDSELVRLRSEIAQVAALWRQQASKYPAVYEAQLAATAVRLCADEILAALARGGE